MPTFYSNTDHYKKLNTSFSGADIVATITPIGGSPKVFGEIQTISYSIYRPMTPVYGLGQINPRGVTRGQRMIAGTLIFTVFDRHVLKSIIDSFNAQSIANYNTNTDVNNQVKDIYQFSASDLELMKKYAKTDEMPPFDINISFDNEYGQSSTLNLYGVHIISEGQTMSIEDMITENTMQYIAMDIDLMDSVKKDDRGDYR